MQRRHFLYLLIAMLALPPLAITGKLPGREAIAQNLTGGTSAATAPANIRGTRHNLSSTAPSRQTTSGNASTTEPVVTSGGAGNNEVCVFCHTPHGATNPGTPLWNRADSGATYTPYSSSSLQATDVDVTTAALGAPSKMCLSCHDGTIALGNVANAPGPGTGSAIALSGFGTTAPTTPAQSMPFGRNLANADHGFTRRLGADLRNDHPISFTYGATLATADGELRTPPSTLNSRPLIANRVAGSPKPYFPLVGDKVQCTTCHDPHKQTQKFLNSNRMVRVAPQTIQTSYTDWTLNIDDDQICVACHTRLGKAWAVSAHSSSVDANETYNAGDAAMRDFPTGSTVWQAGCLNCHDPHTVAGSRRLLREGSGSATGSVTPGTVGFTAAYRLGLTSVADYATSSAIENTCYQCHGNTPVITPTAISGGNTVPSNSEGVPNIQADFALLYHMPITNNEQGQAGAGNTTEVHDITDRENTESQVKLGQGTPANRHAECTDCHNTHRVLKADTFLGANLAGGDVTRRTHVPARGTVGEYGNIAGGALRGTWGVEPSYTATGQTTVTGISIWKDENVTYTVKKGDPGAATTLPVGSAGTNAAAYLTREYQLCFKCHSSYANGPLATDFPQLKATTGRGGTPSGTNGMTRYTDVAKEFAVRATDPPSTGLDQGEFGECGATCLEDGTALEPAGSQPADTGEGGVMTTLAGTQNHRSWHPVVFPTGRTWDERRISSRPGNFRAPFATDGKLGLQTMHCSDCHGAGSSWTPGTGPTLTAVQGPHGSSNPFVLRGTWSTATTISSTGLCGNCHNPTAGAIGTGDNTAGRTSGFNDAGADGGGGHGNAHANGPCMRCHVAVPHGWKNKALLVNLNCVGQEAGQVSTCVSVGNGPYNVGPYYNSAYLRVRTWVASGNWAATSCGFAAGGAGGQSGKTWMKDNAGCDLP